MLRLLWLTWSSCARVVEPWLSWRRLRLMTCRQLPITSNYCRALARAVGCQASSYIDVYCVILCHTLHLSGHMHVHDILMSYIIDHMITFYDFTLFKKYLYIHAIYFIIQYAFTIFHKMVCTVCSGDWAGTVHTCFTEAWWLHCTQIKLLRRPWHMQWNKAKPSLWCPAVSLDLASDASDVSNASCC